MKTKSILKKNLPSNVELHKPKHNNKLFVQQNVKQLPEILFISSYPPRECGIATYSQDLIKALHNKFQKSFAIKICALETETEKHHYPAEVKYILNTEQADSYIELADDINDNDDIPLVLLQHEFGLFKNNEDNLNQFLNNINKPVILVFHTVLPHPDEDFALKVKQLVEKVESIIVMTHSAAHILEQDYLVPNEKITVIGHGTHLVEHADREALKKKYQVSGRKILSTFGLLSSGKSIETTLDALPMIIKKKPEVLFLIIGKTHPTVVKYDGEQYRDFLNEKIRELKLENNVRFVNSFLPLDDLLEYLQLTDIYLFTSKNPNQAVSGTFSYAISCGCPIISTPIPHACEVLQSSNTGVIIDFGNSGQLAAEVNKLLLNEQLRKEISLNGLHKMAPHAWENSALAHAKLFKKINNKISLTYKIPEINLKHIEKMTTSFGMIQFSEINQPDISSGYTLDDNARALIAFCQHFKITNDKSDLEYIVRYFNFIKFCLQADGSFLNYVDADKKFTGQNNENLEDSNGRAIWALGYLNSISDILPNELAMMAQSTLQLALRNGNKIHSTRAMAFVIKGIYYNNIKYKSVENIALLKQLANRIVQMYRHESSDKWLWYESYLTYANSILPEALLCAHLVTGDMVYREIAQKSFDFLITKVFRDNKIKVISNKGWLQNGEEPTPDRIGGEQPIDVAYTILALNKFYDVFKDEKYLIKMKVAFTWFLGNNHLNQIIYNPCTGGCYDGLEDEYINLNQGAESTISYLMARLAFEKIIQDKRNLRRALFLVTKLMGKA